MILVAIVIGAYILGSIPVGYLTARAKGVDILQFGSGNIGATNVHRALGKWLGLLVFFLDVLKGFAPALLTYQITHSQVSAFWVGMAAVTGHCLSPFLKFRGGKGIATGLGAVLGSCPLLALGVFAVFLVSLVASRYISLSSIISAIALIPLAVLLRASPYLYAPLGVLAIFVIFRHRPNIKRLMNGSEPKFSLARKVTTNPPGGALLGGPGVPQ